MGSLKMCPTVNDQRATFDHYYRSAPILLLVAKCVIDAMLEGLVKCSLRTIDDTVTPKRNILIIPNNCITIHLFDYFKPPFYF